MLIFTKRTYISFFSVLCFLFATHAQAQLPTNQQVVERADEYLTAAMKYDRFIGSVLIARDGVPVVNKGYGMASIELGVPNTPKTIFRTGSLAKGFTSMAVMQLQERGKLKTSDPICKYLDNCPAAWQPVTIRNLLTHTSGIPNYSSQPDWDTKHSMLPYTFMEFIGLVNNLPLEFTPGEKHKYSNTGYVLLGQIIEKTSGKKYTDFVRENIFVPLQMKDTGFENSSQILHNRAAGYDWSLGTFLNANYVNLKNSMPSGGIYSTTEDMLRWDQALYTEKLVTKKSMDEIFTPFLSEYAYGWRRPKRFNRQIIEHSGSINGFSAYILRSPADRLTVIVLSNSDKTSGGKAGVNLTAIALGETYKVPVAQMSDVLALTIVKDGVEKAVKQYHDIKQSQSDKYDLREHQLDELGWNLLDNDRATDAIEILKLNTGAFPASANAYDSLGEAYFQMKNYGPALAAFKKFLELDPKSEHAKEMINKIEETTKK